MSLATDGFSAMIRALPITKDLYTLFGSEANSMQKSVESGLKPQGCQRSVLNHSKPLWLFAFVAINFVAFPLSLFRSGASDKGGATKVPTKLSPKLQRQRSNRSWGKR